jgi:hypothetical protein
LTSDIRRSVRLTSVCSTAVAAVHNQVLCVAAVLAWDFPGVLGIWLDAAATPKERDAGERGQQVHELVLERRVTGMRRGRLPLPVIPVPSGGVPLGRVTARQTNSLV